MELKRERQLSVEADGVDSDEESATPDWRVRAGPRNRPTQKNMEEHEATHVPLRDRCTHFMMGSGRTHHHATKQSSEDETRRPIFAMDFYFMRMQPAVNSQTISEEEVTCTAVNEDRHRTGIGCVQNRVDEMYKAEVTTEDAVKGDKESNGLIENAVMQIRGIIRTIKRHTESVTQEPRSDESPTLPWLVEHAGCILSRSHKGRDGKTPSERLHWKCRRKNLFRLLRRCWQNKSPQIR